MVDIIHIQADTKEEADKIIGYLANYNGWREEEGRSKEDFVADYFARQVEDIVKSEQRREDLEAWRAERQSTLQAERLTVRTVARPETVDKKVESTQLPRR